MANFVYTNFKKNVSKKSYDLSADTLKVALFTSSYTPNQDTDTVYSGLSGEVANGNGYATGGAALAGVAVAADNTNHRMKLTANNVTWSSASITARYAVLYHSTSGDLIALYDFGSNFVSTSGNFTVTWDASNGVLDLT